MPGLATCTLPSPLGKGILIANMYCHERSEDLPRTSKGAPSLPVLAGVLYGGPPRTPYRRSSQNTSSTTLMDGLLRPHFGAASSASICVRQS
jgi:hypothetical protein